MNRRTILKGGIVLAATSHTAVAVADMPDAPPAAPIEENPDLIRANDDLIAARSDLKSAKNALEWFCDEWRHRWPAAPEKILGIANADRVYECENAETDIAGRFIYRDTGDLLVRMTPEMQARTPRSCFAVERPDWLKERVAMWERPVTARTPKALAKKLAEQDRVLTKFREKLRLSESYWAETARLREASGVEQVKKRVADAERAVDVAADRVSRIPALTHSGLCIKAYAIAGGGHFDRFLECTGILGEMSRLVSSMRDIQARSLT